MKIVIYPDNILRVPCTLVAGRLVSDDIIDPMLALAGKLKAAGLAAPQVGISESFFLAKTEKDFELFVNPVITPTSSLQTIGPEGCLSFPGVVVEVPRYTEVRVEYTDRVGEFQTVVLSGTAARIIQHENDHLLGKLIIDHMSCSAKMFNSALKRLKRK